MADDAKDQETARANANNAKNIRNAADVAIASKNPYAVAAGSAVKVADKVTGGKSTEALGKAMTKANKASPIVGKKIQNASNKLSESGASDKIGQAAAAKSGMAGGAKGGGASGSLPSSASKGGSSGIAALDKRGQNTPPPQSGSNTPQTEGGAAASKGNGGEGEAKESGHKKVGGVGGSRPKFIDDGSDSEDNEGREGSSSAVGKFIVNTAIKVAVLTFTPFLLIILIIVLVIGGISGGFENFEDMFGASEVAGEDTGGDAYGTSSPEAEDFYSRANLVKLALQAQGKNITVADLAAVYSVLDQNGADVTYKDMTEAKLYQIAEQLTAADPVTALANGIFKEYFPKFTLDDRKSMAEDVASHKDDYNDLIGNFDGSSNSNACSTSGGSCNYDIKGFYIQGKGNVSQQLKINNLKVRLMQCGSANGHNYGGTFGKPLEGEELVDFEKYILGVAYQEIGPDAPDEAIKAQMVAARSYILARPTDMGGWRSLKQENGQWILQVASCTQDQVYCDPDKGCSGTDGQWGQVHSGLNYSGFRRNPLPANHKMRTLATEVQGEVLVNNAGNVIYAGYLSTEQNQMSALAKKGLNYKQILLQVYNSGSRKYGATDVTKMSCSNSDGTTCTGVSSGEFSKWKQSDPAWGNVPVGTGGSIRSIGCLATSVAILIAKSGVQTNVNPFNPGTFVEALNKSGGFVNGGNYSWGAESKVAPRFKHGGSVGLEGNSRTDKLNKIKNLVNGGYYVTCEVKGSTGQHWVAIDAIQGDNIIMMDPGSQATNMWQQYSWNNTSICHYFKVE